MHYMFQKFILPSFAAIAALGLISCSPPAHKKDLQNHGKKDSAIVLGRLCLGDWVFEFSVDCLKKRPLF